MKRKVLYFIGTLILSAFFVFQGLNTDIFAEGDNGPILSDDTTIDIEVEKVWQDADDADGQRPESITVDLKNGDTVVRTITISKGEDDKWTGVFENVPRTDEQGNEITYTVEERAVNGYSPTVEQGEIVSAYDYPTNTSDVELDTSTHVSDTVNVHGGTDWNINQGLETDYIKGTNLVVDRSKLSIDGDGFSMTEYDADGNLVPQNERVFYTDKRKESSSESSTYWTIVYNQAKDAVNAGKGTGSLLNVDHYLEIRFKDAVTILDGTTGGTTKDLVLLVDQISISKTKNATNTGLFYYTSSLGAKGAYLMGGNSMRINFRVPGVEAGEGETLLPFTDVDITANYTVPGSGPRNESVYLVSGFDHTFYTVDLYTNNTSTTALRYTKFEQQTDGSMRGFGYYSNNTSGDLTAAFITRADFGGNGATIRWTGSNCATALFNQLKPFKLKATVDQEIASHNGGSISEQHDWMYRDYGQAKAITITPDEGYHIKYLTIDENEIDLDDFDENGYMEVTAGYTNTDPTLNPGILNTGTETVKLYQRADGVIDVYLPAQYYAKNKTTQNRSDHWIDTGFEPNGLAENYTITNALNTSISGTKTWVSGTATHPENANLSIVLKQNGEEYAYDTSQITWEDNKYTISNLPKYDNDGNAYVYTVTEKPPAGFEVTQDGYDLVNTLKQEYITVQGKKTWKDGGKTHNNAEDLTVTLYRATTTDGTNYSSPVEQDNVPTWEGNTYKFENLPKYDENRFEYKYTVHETVNIDPGNGDTYNSTTDDTGRNFTNTLTGVTTFSGTKTWLDGGKEHNNEQDLSLVLMRNTAENTRKNQWTGSNDYPLGFSWDGNTFTYTNLPKYDDNGNEFNYSVRENRVMGKTASSADYDIYYDGEYWDFPSFNPQSEAYQVTGTDITNAIRGDIVVSKTWTDDNDRDGKRPTSITVHLKKGDTELESATLSGTSWSHTFTNLPFYDDQGEAINYTVTEDPIKDQAGNELYTPEYGDLTWNEDHTGCTISIENTHEPETVDIPVEKVWVDGNDADELRPDSITVTLYADGEKTDETLTLSANEDDPDKNWKGAFEKLPKNKEGEVGQEIEYSVKEEAADVPGGYSVAVSKTDDGVWEVTNTHVTYTKKTLEGSKTLTGRDMAAEEFEFKLSLEEGPDSVVFPESAKAPAAADGVAGSFEFKNILFKEKGTYKFKLVEVIPDTLLGGVEYDEHECIFTVVVKEKDNALSVEEPITIGPKKDSNQFKNEYEAKGDFTPEGEKTLTGQSEVEDSEATGDDTGNTEPPAAKKSADVSDDSDADDSADVEAQNIEGGEDDAMIEEEEEAEENVQTEAKMGAAEVDAEVEAQSVGEGEDDAVIEEEEEAEPPSEGEEDADADAEVEAQNVEEGNGDAVIEEEADAEEDVQAEAKMEAVEGETEVIADEAKGEEVAMAMTKGQFKFEGRYANGDDTDTVVFEGENEAADAGEAAKITFEQIKYATSDLKKLVADGAATKDDNGVYHISYVITEKAPNGAFQYNPQTFTMEVLVTDDGMGTLLIEVHSSTEISFTNRYITDTAIVPLDGLKHFSTEKGTRTLKEGDFSFTVTPLNNAPAPEKATAENDAGGAIHFGDIEFTKADIGDNTEKTFTYEISEAQGGVHGMTYDEGTKTVKITVTDDGEGHLTATTDPESAPLFEFENTYEPDPVSETINADIAIKKVLKGRDLEEGEFDFTIEAADDETQEAIDSGDVVMPDSVTESNDAEGDVAFDKITYNKAGTYKFTISEVIPDEGSDDMIYDDTVYTAVVVVGDDEEGHLVIEEQSLSGGEAKAVFTNEYIPPEEPDEPDEPDEPEEPDNPDEPEKGDGTRTGDDMNLLIPILLLIGSAGAAAGVLRTRRNRKA